MIICCEGRPGQGKSYRTIRQIVNKYQERNTMQENIKRPPCLFSKRFSMFFVRFSLDLDLPAWVVNAINRGHAAVAALNTTGKHQDTWQFVW